MKLFSGSKRQGNFTLTVSDFKTESETVVVKSVWIDPDFLASLPKEQIADKKASPEIRSSKAIIKLFETSVEIIFDPDKIEGDQEGLVNKINKQLDWLSSNKALVDNVIARDLLKIKNTSWLNEGETAITGEQLTNSVNLRYITFSGDGSCELYFNDGDTFAGHEIVVSVSKDREVKKAELAG